jgi:hypothetical protein
LVLEQHEDPATASGVIASAAAAQNRVRFGKASRDDDLVRSGSGCTARPSFEWLMAGLRAGEVGAVLCFDVSRLSMGTPSRLNSGRFC